MVSGLRAIAFDLDDTLWDIEPVIDRAERRMLEWLREHYPRIAERFSLDEMRAARERLARAEPHRAHDLVYLRVEALAGHARQCGYAADVANGAFEVFCAARNEIDPFGDVRPALERLRERFVLASLSNGNADLARVGLADLFAVSLNARQIGAAKPHARCFEALSQALALEPQRILYVGDDPVLDVAAARAVGLLAAWINRRGVPWPTRLAAPELVVPDCTALAEALVPRS
jgi:FMN hydrolase / 5-amino-6-(5-phospho-D-ribitylamino)uracil phosphatase